MTAGLLVALGGLLFVGCAADSSNDDLAYSSTTNLYWQRCAVGAEWDGAACIGEPTELDWSASGDACEAAGPGFRLPTLDEVASLLGACTEGGAAASCASCLDSLECSSVLADERYDWTWTADPTESGAFVVDLREGRIAFDEMDSRFHARCVVETR